METNPRKLYGTVVAESIKDQCKLLVEKVLKKYDITPELYVLTNPNDKAGEIYVRQKEKAAEQIGIVLTKCDMSYLSYLKRRHSLDAPLIVQLPTACNESDMQYIKEKFITPQNDVDGFLCAENVSNLLMGKDAVNYPCTPSGISYLLDWYDIKPEGKIVTIIGRSNIVGKPLAALLSNRNATVTLCHSKTDHDYMVQQAACSDIVISSVGKRNVITYNEISSCCKDISGITFVDVGMNHDENGKLCGDFDPEIFNHCYAYTPVPGGVGPMTVAFLMSNVVHYYLAKLNEEEVVL